MTQRQLEFRAWDKDNKVMSKPFGIVHEQELYSDKDIVMQFTGLYDKHGKKIFEGDILDYDLEELRISVRWDVSGANWQFDDHTTFDDGVGRGEWNLNIGIAKNSEVIGNVYQNKELLQTNNE